ncbi:MAG: hypothetical protein QM775_31855 [Pirellulales bacterium]
MVSEVAIIAGVREGDVRLAFNPTGFDFTPTYVGAEQLYPVALVEMTLPVASGVTAVSAKLIVAGSILDGEDEFASTDYPDIVGQDVSYALDGGFDDNDRLQFAVPLKGEDLHDLRSGRHAFYVVFTVTDSTGTHTLTQRGVFDWQNRFDKTYGQTEFGDGWDIPEMSRLIYTSANGATRFQGGVAGERGITLLNGDGTSEWYEMELVDTPLQSGAMGIEDDEAWKLTYLGYVAESGGTVVYTFAGLKPARCTN